MAFAIRVLAGLVMVVTSACQLAENYPDPAGPRHAGDHTRLPPPNAGPLLVVTYNLAHAEAIDRAIAVLSAPPLANADVLLMQEMDAPGCDRIAAALGMRYVYYPSSVSQGRDFGNAVLTPHPITADHKLLLPHADGVNGRLRTATATQLDLAGVPLTVYSVHTSIPTLGLGGRLDQAQAVIDDAAGALGPVLVAGDFNTGDPGSADQTVDLFARRGLAWASRGISDTGSNYGLYFQLDYVFVQGLIARQAGLFTGDAGSDHRPVWVRLDRPSPP